MNNNIDIQWFSFGEEGTIPFKKHPDDAGFDLSYWGDDLIQIAPNSRATVPTGAGFVIPQGYYGQVLDRSSMSQRGLIVAGGVIDSGYRGEVKVIMWNVADFPITIAPRQFIAQIVFIPCFVGELTQIPLDKRDTTQRGSNGFGSTGE